MGDDIVTIDDVSGMVQVFTHGGEKIVMLSGSRIDFDRVRDWLTGEGNVERSSYQGEELWGDDSVARVPLTVI